MEPALTLKLHGDTFAFSERGALLLQRAKPIGDVVALDDKLLRITNDLTVKEQLIRESNDADAFMKKRLADSMQTSLQEVAHAETIADRFVDSVDAAHSHCQEGDPDRVTFIRLHAYFKTKRDMMIALAERLDPSE
jgi:hypothetical protein